MSLQLITPANTPATPPNFPDALTMFSKMSTSDATRMATSPLAPSSISPRNQQNSSLNSRNSFSPGMMSPPPAPPPCAGCIKAESLAAQGGSNRRRLGAKGALNKETSEMHH